MERVLAARTAGAPIIGEILLVEHDPVVTISNRAGAEGNLLVPRDLLAQRGISVEPTDRGGDITYHGPGQIVVYPILDLNRLNLGLHDYMRLLEQSVMDACTALGVPTTRDPGATGVWTVRPNLSVSALGVSSEASGASVPPGLESVRGLALSPASQPLAQAPLQPHAKIAAMGVRVRRWISTHGLALNVRTDLSHFGVIVPCGLVGRPVTSLSAELGDACPPTGDVARVLIERLSALIVQADAEAVRKRANA